MNEPKPADVLSMRITGMIEDMRTCAGSTLFENARIRAGYR